MSLNPTKIKGVTIDNTLKFEHFKNMRREAAQKCDSPFLRP